MTITAASESTASAPTSAPSSNAPTPTASSPMTTYWDVAKSYANAIHQHRLPDRFSVTESTAFVAMTQKSHEFLMYLEEYLDCLLPATDDAQRTKWQDPSIVKRVQLFVATLSNRLHIHCGLYYTVAKAKWDQTVESVYNQGMTVTIKSFVIAGMTMTRNTAQAVLIQLTSPKGYPAGCQAAGTHFQQVTSGCTSIAYGYLNQIKQGGYINHMKEQANDTVYSIIVKVSQCIPMIEQYLPRPFASPIAFARHRLTTFIRKVAEAKVTNSPSSTDTYGIENVTPARSDESQNAVVL